MRLSIENAIRAVAAAALFLVASAYAQAHEREFDLNGHLKEMREYRAAYVDMTGELICMSDDAPGFAPKSEKDKYCAISIKDGATGKSYELTRAKDAMKLYRQGKTQVKLSGLFVAGGLAIKVREVDAIN